MPIRATIVKWLPMNGYGFARVDSCAGPDVFVHINDVINTKFLHVGDRIECEFELQEHRQKKPMARRVKLMRE